MRKIIEINGSITEIEINNDNSIKTVTVVTGDIEGLTNSHKLLWVNSPFQGKYKNIEVKFYIYPTKERRIGQFWLENLVNTDDRKMRTPCPIYKKIQLVIVEESNGFEIEKESTVIKIILDSILR